MKKLFLFVGALATAICGNAQTSSNHAAELDGELMRFDLQMRADYDYVNQDGHENDAFSGIDGKYLMFRVDGEIMPGLTYSVRQRFNKNPQNFNATDWAWIGYTTGRWNFSGGKEIVAIGGYEYDRAPQDLYECSAYWNNTACYAFGATVGYGITSKDRVKFQVTRSPFEINNVKNTYTYNLMWTGNHGCYSSIWSANLIEYDKGHYINFLALGNKFTFGNVWLELDYMNRAASHQKFLFKDCSVMAELSVSPSEKCRIFGKYTYDINHTGTDADHIVLNGTRINMGGAGVEYYPIRGRKNTLRLHAAAFYSWGENTNTALAMQNKTFHLQAGVTWDMNLLNIKRK